MKDLVIFGACGSVGRSAICALGKINKTYNVVCISLDNDNIKNDFVLEKIKTKYALYQDNIQKKDLNYLINKYKSVKFLSFKDNFKKILKEYEGAYFFNALPSIYGIKPLVLSIKYNYKKIFLANKESIVMAGDIILKEALKKNIKVIPIDSEHYAIKKLVSQNHNINKIIITASGGAVLDKNPEQLKNIKKEEILKHPVWSMGNEITINSSTMANKAYEVCEASRLFNISIKDIIVKIHPEGIVHGGVILNDGRTLLNLSKPDMIHPIMLALSGDKVNSLEYQNSLDSLTFEEVDDKKYPIFYLGIRYFLQGRLYNTLFLTINQALVNLYLENKIEYIDIYNNLEKLLKEYEYLVNEYKYEIEDIIKLSQFLYSEVIKKWK